jgi:hypothetical protein
MKPTVHVWRLAFYGNFLTSRLSGSVSQHRTKPLTYYYTIPLTTLSLFHNIWYRMVEGLMNGKLEKKKTLKVAVEPISTDEKRILSTRQRICMV